MWSTRTEAKMLRRTTKPIVVAVVGHVDQGKTTLLGAILGSDLAKKEEGSITQNIGVHSHWHHNRHLILVDTPGHEALVSTRDFGSTLADIVVIVVGLDTSSRTDHRVTSLAVLTSRKPVLIGLNKIDRFPTQAQEVESSIRKQGVGNLTSKGNGRFIRLSASEGIGIRQLLDTICQEVEVKLVLFGVPAQGTIVDSSVGVKTGITAALLIQLGTLEVGDILLVGASYTRVKALRNEHGFAIKAATPHHLVTILGLSAIPKKGVRFLSVRSERRAKGILAEKHRQPIFVSKSAVSPHLEVANLFSKGRCHLGCFILKARTANMLDAVSNLLGGIGKKWDTDLRIISKSLGPITGGDVRLATISKARIITIGLPPDHRSSKLLGQASISWKNYSLIFEIAADIELELQNIRDRRLNSGPASEALVRRLFGKVGAEVILGCFVSVGKLSVGQEVTVMRLDQEVGSCHIRALRRFRESIPEVTAKEECGVSVMPDREVEFRIGDSLCVRDSSQPDR